MIRLRGGAPLIVAMALALGGCDDDGGGGDAALPTVDAAVDGAIDGGPDAAPDMAPDPMPDATPDVTVDAAPDVTVDAAPDAMSDATVDAIIDAGPDAAPDASPDAAIDAEPDAAIDAEVDRGPPPCVADGECADFEICVEGACVPAPGCLVDFDCVPGRLCGDGVCLRAAACDAETPCPADRPCIDGACARITCADDGACGDGSLCLAGRCAVADCRDAFDCGPGERCLRNTCLVGDCLDDGDCGPSGLCEDNRCAPGDCRVDEQCDPGSLCLDNTCTPADCRADADCPAGSLCLDDRCVAGDCRADADCGAGALCEANACVPGDCRDDAACPDGELCFDLSCAPADCRQDGECPPGALCLENRCVEADCRGDAECGASESCIRNTCVVGDCLDATDCDPGQSCIRNACVDGDCLADPDCADGELCLDQTCTVADCRADADCPDGALCFDNQCTPADCRITADCDDGQTCIRNACIDGDCLVDPDCADGELCLDQTCTVADCRIDVDCAPGEGCIRNTCVDGDCLEDLDCADGVLCLGNDCTPGGCRGDDDCGFGSLCFDQRCEEAECRDDAGCRVGQICLARACISGDCRDDGECADGELCLSNNCTPADCRITADCPGDENCVRNTCVDGDCLDDGDCGAGALCLGNTCTPGDCRVDGECADDELCLANACTAADCRIDGDCAAGELCLANACTAADCRVVADCAAGELCEDNRCVPDPALASCRAAALFPADGILRGDLRGGPAVQAGSCGGDGAEQVYARTLADGPQCLRLVEADGPLILHARADCGDGATEAACADRPPAGTGLTLDGPAGADWFVFVDAPAGSEGRFTLSLVDGPCPDPCAADDACAAGELCLDGLCRPAPACAADPACPEGRICLAGRCAPPQCAADGDCAATELCLEQRCVEADCREDADCDEGLCFENACQLGRCRADDDCPEGLCIDTVCLADGCRADEDCAEGLCIGNRCLADGCRADEDCAEGLCIGDRCLADGCRADGDCPAGICTGNRCDPDGCRFDEQCPEGDLCVDGACVEGDCREDLDCEGGICVDNVCGPPECDGDALPCAEGLACIGGRCVEGGGEIGVCESPVLIEPGAEVRGTLIGAPSEVEGFCGGAGPESVYVFEPPFPAPYCVQITRADFDTTLSVLVECGELESTLDCNDDGEVAGGLLSDLTILPIFGEGGSPERYFIYVEGLEAEDVGTFDMRVDFGECGQEFFCEGPFDCPPGLACFDGLCGPAECDVDGDCPAGDVCEFGACREPECVVDGDCFEGAVCQDNTCIVPECFEDADCDFGGEGEIGGGLVCRNLRCIPDVPIGTCAEPLPIDRDPVLGTTIFADAEHQPACGLGGDSPEQVFAYVAQRDGPHCAAVIDADFAPTVSVRAVCADDETTLVCAEGVEGSPEASFDAVQGATYFVLVDSFFPGDAGGFELTVSRGVCGEPPTCDFDADCLDDELCLDGVCIVDPCATPTMLDEPGVYEASNRDALALHTAGCGLDLDGPERIFAVTPEVDGPICLDTLASNFDTVLSVRRGLCDDLLSEVACNDDDASSNRRQSRVELDAAAGETYYVLVDGTQGGTGDIALAMSEGPCDFGEGACYADDDCPEGTRCIAKACVEAPDLGGCADPMPIDDFGIIEGNTRQNGEAVFGAVCGGGAASVEDVYVFRPETSGPVCFNLDGTLHDTVLHVRAGICTSGSAQVACNDDAPGLAAGVASAATVQAVAGQDYYVFVDGFGFARGAYTLTVSDGPCRPPCEENADCGLGETCVAGGCAVACADDGECRAGERCVAGGCESAPVSGTCADPIPIEAAVGQYFADTAGAPARFEPICVPADSGPEAVFSLTPAEDSELCLTTEGSAFDAVLSVTGSPCGEAAPLTCADDNDIDLSSPFDSAVSLAARAGETYYVILDGVGSGAGEAVLNVREGRCRRPAVCELRDDLILDPGGAVTRFQIDNRGLPDVYDSTCGSSTGPERIIAFDVDQPTQIDIEIVAADHDTKMYLRQPCDGELFDVTVACDDDGGNGLLSRITRALEPGTYYLFIEGYSGRTGTSTVEIRREPIEDDDPGFPDGPIGVE